MKNVIRDSRFVIRTLLTAFFITAATASADNIVITNSDTQPVPVRQAAYGAEVRSAAKENGHVIRAAASKLSILTVTSDSDQYILIMDSATVPANGAVTLLHPPIHVAANSTTMINFAVPLVATTGISVCNSNANSFTKTIGAADCIFYARWQ